MSELTRRQFLHSAGGLIFLLLVPVGRGLFAAPDGAGGSLPRFTALPYVQPGPSSRLLAGEESVGIAWQTEAHPAGFALDYGPTRQCGKPALHRFIADDLTRTDARWKFVIYHHPAFNVGDKHYAEQHMRVLSPSSSSTRWTSACMATSTSTSAPGRCASAPPTPPRRPPPTAPSGLSPACSP